MLPSLLYNNYWHQSGICKVMWLFRHDCFLVALPQLSGIPGDVPGVVGCEEWPTGSLCPQHLLRAMLGAESVGPKTGTEHRAPLLTVTASSQRPHQTHSTDLWCHTVSGHTVQPDGRGCRNSLEWCNVGILWAECIMAIVSSFPVFQSE